MQYNWQQPGWPKFSYSLNRIEDTLLAFACETGHVSGMLKAMPENNRTEAILDTMVSEAIKTSEIEGEFLSRRDIVSSIRNNLGLNKTPDRIRDKKARGVGQLMTDVRNTFADQLSAKTLLLWHKTLMGPGSTIAIGARRKHKEPMQVISGAMGKEKVHFEAPPSASVPGEMKQFIQWFNDTAPGGKAEIKKAPVRSAIAHLYFESIHPFEDGNGRIGRAIAEKALSQTLGYPVLLSLSQTIEANRMAYYNALQKAQRSNNITAWVEYFVNVISDAQFQAKKSIEFTLKKTAFFDGLKSKLNNRQIKAVNKMLDEGPKGFIGGMTAKKYLSITRCSKATATRDLQELADLQVLIAEGGGRSTRYNLNIE